MKLQIQTISDKNTWERFNLSFKNASIFQAWSFGQAEKNLGEKIDRLGFFNGNKLCGIAQVKQVMAKRGHFLHIRGGPVFQNFTRHFPKFFPLIINFAKEKKVSFIRISPPIILGSIRSDFLDKLGFLNAPIPLLDGEASWVLDLDKNEEQLLLGMRKTTRYLIRKAQKIGIIVKQSKLLEDAYQLLKIYEIMVKEKGIIPHKGIIEEFKEFAKDDQALIFSGYYQNKLLGAALIIFYGEEGIYHHSAHLRLKTDIPVSYLIQWKAILEAKKRGKKRYNFWGVEPTGSQNHPWAGLTLFKKGFGGRLRQFIKAKDYPLSPLYRLTWLIETIRRIKRYKMLSY